MVGFRAYNLTPKLLPALSISPLSSLTDEITMEICLRSLWALCIVHSETVDSFSWFLRQFVLCYEAVPEFVCVDQDAAILRAVEDIFAGCIVLLDAYHLNINQLKHSITISTRWAGTLSEDTANKRFFELRGSLTEALFLQRRAQFEYTFLRNFSGAGGVAVDGKYVPRWFYSLYYTLKEKVVTCYNRLQGGLRFCSKEADIPKALMRTTADK